VSGFIGQVSGGDATGDFTLDISSLDVQSGDLGILFTGSDDGDDNFTVTGFTNRARIGVSGPSGNGEATVFTKVMTGSETSISSSGGADLVQTAIVFALFRGLDYISIATARSESDGDPNPPAVTVSAGDWVVVGGYQDDDVQSISAPTNYTLISSQTQGTAGDGFTTAAAYRENLSAGTEDPGVMSSAGSDPWAAVSIVLRPS
jgi:hypothetical protein